MLPALYLVTEATLAGALSDTRGYKQHPYKTSVIGRDTEEHRLSGHARCPCPIAWFARNKFRPSHQITVTVWPDHQPDFSAGWIDLADILGTEIDSNVDPGFVWFGG